MRLFLVWLGLLPFIAYAQSGLSISSLPLGTRDDILSLSPSTGSSVLVDTLIPRPVGSKNLTALQDQYEKRFKALKWHTERDEFEADTPQGRKSFRNSIFVSDPSKPRTIVLAAHIDSLPSLEGFVGAIDSAAPCAILLDAATALTPWLQSTQSNSDTSLTIILFDGEEAFVRWTATDSIYGARHLAEVWSKPQSTPTASLRTSSRLASINVFILLDLLGTKSPNIRSYYRNTHWLFQRFQSAQHRLGEAQLLQSKDDFFSQGVYRGHIEGPCDLFRSQGKNRAEPPCSSQTTTSHSFAQACPSCI